jgi:hypothetical protein
MGKGKTFNLHRKQHAGFGPQINTGFLIPQIRAIRGSSFGLPFSAGLEIIQTSTTRNSPG